MINKTVEVDSEKTLGGKVVPPELRIIQSKSFIEHPSVTQYCRLVEPLEVKGIVFDLDGTLTLPGALDLGRIRERTGVPDGVDIVPYLRRQHADDPEAFKAAMGIIDEEERMAFSPPKLRKGVKECILRLVKRGIRLGIVTRNAPPCVEAFMSHLKLPEGTFYPIVTRDSDMPNKPDPASMRHCCSEWGLEPSQVVMVGDGVDDMRCGKAAGSRSIGMLCPNAGSPSDLDLSFAEFAQADARLAAEADFSVSSLAALEARLLPQL